VGHSLTLIAGDHEMARSRDIFFGDASGALAQASTYPALPDLDFPEDMTLSPRSGASGFDAGASRSWSGESPLGPQIDHLAERAEKAVGQAKDMAQAALSSTLASARDYAPELKAMSERARERAAAAGGEARRRAISTLDSPRTRTAVVAVGVVAGLVALAWVTVPFAVSAVRSGIIQGVAMATSDAISQWINSRSDPAPRLEQPGDRTAEPRKLAPVPPPPPSPPVVARAPLVVSGPAQAIDTATVIVGGKTLVLIGLEPVRQDGATQGFNAYLKQSGNVRCQATAPDADTAICVTERGVDIAETAILSGMATAGPEASDKLRRAQREAKQNRSGIWGMR
jgi:hypothetical protein